MATELSTVKKQWSIRRYQPGDERQILELRAVTLDRLITEEQWSWQFNDNPVGSPIIWLAEVENKIIGQYAILPLHMMINGETRTGSLSLDTMTHPDYQHQGIFTTLAKTTFKDVSTKIHLTYGIPNDLSYSGFIKKLQWFHICTIPQMVKILQWDKVLREYRIPSFIGKCLGYIFKVKNNRVVFPYNPSIKIKQIMSFDDRINEFWLKASGLKGVMVVRDKEYLNWRYANKPDHNYKVFIAENEKDILGYIVITLKRNNLVRGFIVDLLALPNSTHIAQILITKIIEYFQGSGADIVECWMLENAPYYAILKKLGFIKRNIWNPLCARINTQVLSNQFVSNPNNWYFVMGDQDTI
jgi:hypothetical protein